MLWGVVSHKFGPTTIQAYNLAIQLIEVSFIFPFTWFDFVFKTSGMKHELQLFEQSVSMNFIFWFELVSQTTCELSSKLALIINYISLTVVMIAIELTIPPSRWSLSYNYWTIWTLYVWTIVHILNYWNYKDSMCYNA